MRLVVFTGDLHVNSTVALCPPVVPLDDGGEYLVSRQQAWIWERWLEFCREVGRQKEHHACEVHAVLNGELQDDNHHKTSQLISANEEDQGRASLAAMEPLLEHTDTVVVTRGSEAHSGTNAHHDEKLAKAIGALSDPETGQKARWWYRDVIEGVTIDVAHHPGTGHMRPWTRGGDANRLAQIVMSWYVEQQMRPPDLVVRGHIHKPSESYDNHLSRAVILPSWQLSTSFGHRLGGGVLPIGGMIMLFNDGRIEFDRKMFWRWPLKSWSELS